MPDGSVTRIEPHNEVLIVVVEKRSLDERSTRELVEEVLTAAAQTPRVPIVLCWARSHRGTTGLPFFGP